MYLSFSDALCEAAVESKISTALCGAADGSKINAGHCASGAKSEIQKKASDDNYRLAASFRKQADSIYTEVPPSKREAAFFALYRHYFSELGFPKRVKNILSEFTGEGDLPPECFFVRTFRGEEEGAQLSEDGSRLGFQIKIETLLDPHSFAYLLRHELIHILDILDPAFGYDSDRPLSEVSPSEDALFRDRYRTLWDLSVDGRLEWEGSLPDDLKKRRAMEFGALFPNLSERAAEQALSALWGGARPTSEEFRQMITGAAPLCAVLNIAAGISDEGEPLPAFGPGTLCPLCHFPTHEWAEKTDGLSRAVKEEYPAWEPDQGICSQCANRYLFTAALSANSPGTISGIIDPVSTSSNGSGMEDI